jgi:creatinine amidohydrolase
VSKSFFPLLTQVEAREAAESGKVVMLPIGTVEGNGPVTPLGYDYLVAESLAKEVAERTGNLWLPPIAFGVSEVLSAFPGTVFIRAELLSAIVESVLQSLIRHGFDHIVLVNNHIPNQQPAEDAVRRVRRETGVLCAALYPAQLARDLSKDLYEGMDGTIGHGSEPGTSIMLHLYPKAVRNDLAEPWPKRDFQGFEIISPFALKHGESQVNVYLELEEVSETGGWADPTQASAERGKEIMRRMVEFSISFLERFAMMDTRAVRPKPRT